MEHAEYERQMEAIKAATARIFAMAETEEEVCRHRPVRAGEARGRLGSVRALTSGERGREPAPKRLGPALEGAIAVQAASCPEGRR